MGLKRIKEKAYPYLFVLPALTILICLLIYPLIFVVYISLLRWDLTAPWISPHFVGLKNYMWAIQDERFLNAVRVTGLYMSGVVSISVCTGFMIALLLHTRYIRVRAFFRTVLVFPYLLPSIVCALSFKWLYEPNFGLLNYIFGTLGLPELAWLSNTSTALIAIIFVEVWWAIPFCFVVLLAGLQSLPQDVYEAAEIDGASRLSRFISITLPLLLPILKVVLFMRLIQAFQMIINVMILTEGGPASKTEVLNFYMWRVGFKYYWMGKAAAISVITIAFIFVLIILAYRLMKTEWEA